jgi:hypothetical protein
MLAAFAGSDSARPGICWKQTHGTAELWPREEDQDAFEDKLAVILLLRTENSFWRLSRNHMRGVNMGLTGCVENHCTVLIYN